MDMSISSELDLPGTVGELRTPYDILRLLRQRAQEFGFTHFTVLKLPFAGEPRMADLAVLSNWPPALTRAYDARRLGAASPAMKRLSESALCFQFGVEEVSSARADGQRAETVALFNKHAMARWAFFPVHSPLFGAGAIAYSGMREALDPREMMTLHMISIGIFDRLAQLRAHRQEDRPRLTERERECLLWTAEGKTSFEIGKIIGISEHTVNYYLNTASGKLKSTNRVQAVAVALRSGLLD